MMNTKKVMAKGNIESNYAKMPMELFDYVQLELISHTDLAVYMKLYDLVNVEQGYAFPTIPQLMVYTRIGSKSTIHRSLRKLVEVNLIEKRKTRWGNNVYYVYKPLSKADLYKLYPDKFEQFKVFENKQMKIAKYDIDRFQQHLQNKEEIV
ncbi:helix-turn-helix domain-containing protein [Priestia megaterium]|uniref:helix-turn-helix domain-containing protein n=1 Tax=Priestia megaterium TaxID=1404 RepID=UPI00301C5424